jgi:hypothetical protein
MKENRVRRVCIYLTEEEYKTLIKAYENTICRNISSYGRKLLLRKPVVAITRNRSIDDFIELGVKLRKELKILLSKDGLTVFEKETAFAKITLIEENLIKLVDLCSQT